MKENLTYVYTKKPDHLCVVILFEDGSLAIIGDEGYGFEYSSDALREADELLASKGYQKNTNLLFWKYFNEKEQQCILIKFPNGKVVIEGQERHKLGNEDDALEKAYELLSSKGFNKVKKSFYQKKQSKPQDLPPLDRNIK